MLDAGVCTIEVGRAFFFKGSGRLCDEGESVLKQSAVWMSGVGKVLGPKRKGGGSLAAKLALLANFLPPHPCRTTRHRCRPRSRLEFSELDTALLIGISPALIFEASLLPCRTLRRRDGQAHEHDRYPDQAAERSAGA